ncbi:MAG: Ferredoxin-1 [Verrucomicrobia bacterium ADurb.Bin474]|nr:4Fe-4S binding protein [Opitutales bacterium]OPZ67638.1 MAG: Ferredoxin-1 [Verrucomicrobia bacterium ADurb.Bin474]
MKFRFHHNGSSLTLDSGLCTGCRRCVEVCPHEVFSMVKGRSVIVDRASCMECGACALNCAPGALSVVSGVGCAAAIINGMLSGKSPSCDCSASCC